MAKREVQFVVTIDAPYSAVRDRLRDDPGAIFGDSRAEDGRTIAHLAATLRDRPVERDMLIEVVTFDEVEGAARESHLVFRGDASEHPELFPHLEGRLDAMPMGTERTAMFFVGTYTPPLGPVGGAVDAVALHRFAEESLLGLLHSTVDRI